MSKDKNILSLEAQDKLDENIRYVQGILELLFCALSSEHIINQDVGVLDVIMDAQFKMTEIKESVGG